MTELAGDGAKEPPTDLVTLLQKKQRAPPQVAILDELVRPVEKDSEWEQVTEMPEVLHSQMQEIQELLDELPQTKDQDEAVEEITDLLKKNQALDKQLREKVNEVEATLHHGLIVTAALSKHELNAHSFSHLGRHWQHEAASSQMS